MTKYGCYMTTGATGLTIYLWYDNDLLHRQDGPAVEVSDGTKYWYWYGKYISVKSQDQFERYLKLKSFW